ncbi:hypothetical protein K501DRAFT_223884 [Backusella circina FSU 941]|nr:hypothetical protein K501DRAFT_223884 [Backusella circina FSU 941]
MLPTDYKTRVGARPMSEVINPSRFMTEADTAGNWYEDLKNYESNLDEMASATLDQNFKEEMQHVDQWYRYLTEAEKTATMYTLLQHSTQVQARFFINLLQQMVKKDPLYSLLTPNNPDQDMQTHLAGAVAKAELEASQRLMSVLPYKTGQVMSRPQTNTNRRTHDRHSFALGDTEEYSRLFGSNDFLTRPAYGGGNTLDSPPLNNNNLTPNGSRRLVGRVASGRTTSPMFNNQGRPHSVIEGDTTYLFAAGSSNSSNTSNNWMNPRRTNPQVGHIGDRKMPERPKSADITNWSLPEDRGANRGFQSAWQPPSSDLMDKDLVDFTSSQPFRRRGNNISRIPAVPETEELVRGTQDLFLDEQQQQRYRKAPPPGMEKHFGYLVSESTTSSTQSLTDEQEYTSDHSDSSLMSSRRRSSMTPQKLKDNTAVKKTTEVVDMEVLKDVPTWLRSLRLHKYNSIFCDNTWQEIVKMNDEDLLAKGVAALGARRKMLKVFETVRAYCDANNIEY